MPELTRRQALAAGAATLAAGVARPAGAQSQAAATGKAVTKGRLKQSVSRWCYQKIRDA